MFAHPEKRYTSIICHILRESNKCFYQFAFGLLQFPFHISLLVACSEPKLLQHVVDQVKKMEAHLTQTLLFILFAQPPSSLLYSFYNIIDCRSCDGSTLLLEL